MSNITKWLPLRDLRLLLNAFVPSQPLESLLVRLNGQKVAVSPC